MERNPTRIRGEVDSSISKVRQDPGYRWLSLFGIDLELEGRWTSEPIEISVRLESALELILNSKFYLPS